jgi:DNA polymerase-3 subunit delta
MSLYTLTGLNSFSLREQVRARLQAFIHEYGDFGLERLNAAEASYGKLLESVQAMPFLAAKRLVVIDAPATNKELAENIESFLQTVNDETDVLFIEPKFDKRSTLYKTLKKQTNFQEFNELDEAALSRWIVTNVKEQGGELSLADARYLTQRVGLNQLRLSNEIAKLLNYSSRITRQSIDELTTPTPQSTVFELLDAALAGNKQKALQLYQEQRQQKVEPQAILGLLAWQLHILAMVKAAGTKSVAEIAGEAKLNPFVVRKAASLGKHLTQTALKQLVEQALRLDIQLKSETIDGDQALQNLLVSM